MATYKKRLTLSFADKSLENIEFLKSYWKTKHQGLLNQAYVYLFDKDVMRIE